LEVLIFTPLEIKSSNRANIRSLSGFTLIELLVVVAIIALLMAILLPTLSRTRAQAKAVACRMNLEQWGLIFSMYTMDNDGYFPSGSSGKMWTEVLEPYHKEPDLRCCPMATKLASPEGAPNPQGGKFLAWGVFDETFAALNLEGVYGSYGMNGHVSNPAPGPELDPWGRDTTKNWRSADVRGASNIPLFLDCMWLGGLPEHYDRPPEHDGECQFGLVGPGMKSFCIDRHNGWTNGVFVDFSVRRIGLKELWKLKWHRKFDTDGGPARDEWPDWMKKFKDFE